nr:uncharacterized protein LOC109191863 [Ipomoea trifida]
MRLSKPPVAGSNGKTMISPAVAIFLTYQESSKDLWEKLEAKYIFEDASSKKFLVSEFNEFKMVDSRPVMEQFHEIIILLGLIRQHGMNMDDSIAIAGIINKLPPSWKKVHRTLMQKKEELTMEQLGSHLYVEEGIRLKESKNKGVAKATGVSEKKRHKWKVNLLVIMAKEVSNGNKTDDSWWVDTGATRDVCKDINLYKIYKSRENGPSMYMGNDSMVKSRGLDKLSCCLLLERN